MQATFDSKPASPDSPRDNADAHLKWQIVGCWVVVAITDERRPKRVLVKIVGE
jgi:hypothetical protein